MNQRHALVIFAVLSLTFFALIVTRPLRQGGSVASGKSVTPPAHASDGLISGGMVTSITIGDPNVVIVPASWSQLKPSARMRYLQAIWESCFQRSGAKNDVHVVDAAGITLQVYTPPTRLPDPATQPPSSE